MRKEHSHSISSIVWVPMYRYHSMFGVHIKLQAFDGMTTDNSEDNHVHIHSTQRAVCTGIPGHRYHIRA